MNPKVNYPVVFIKETRTRPCPEAVQYSPYPHSTLYIHFNIILHLSICVERKSKSEILHTKLVCTDTYNTNFKAFYVCYAVLSVKLAPVPLQTCHHSFCLLDGFMWTKAVTNVNFSRLQRNFVFLTTCLFFCFTKTYQVNAEDFNSV
jgi:hypothetical protein